MLEQVSVNTIFRTTTKKNNQGHYEKSGATEDEINILQNLGYLVDGESTSDKRIVMKDLGQTLFRCVEDNSPDEQKIQLLALNVTRHLQQLHNGQLGTTGYLHRDIHLNNIVIDSDGVVRLIDFGNGTALWGGNEKLNKRFFSVVLVPENTGRKPCSTVKTDVFLLGKTFKMLNSITEQRFSFKAIPTSMIKDMCEGQPGSRIDLSQVCATLKAQLPLNIQLNDRDIKELPKIIMLDANTAQATELDLDKEIEIRSYSRSLFSPVKISMRQYMKKMLNKDSNKAVAVYDAIITGNREKLIEKLSEHRFISCFNTRTTTGMELFDASSYSTAR